jgi:hypothetical protein
MVLFFKLDETDLSDSEERKPKPGLIPTAVEKSGLHDPEIEKTVTRHSSAASRHQEMPITHRLSAKVPEPCRHFK